VLVVSLVEFLVLVLVVFGVSRESVVIVSLMLVESLLCWCW